MALFRLHSKGWTSAQSVPLCQLGDRPVIFLLEGSQWPFFSSFSIFPASSSGFLGSPLLEAYTVGPLLSHRIKENSSPPPSLVGLSPNGTRTIVRLGFLLCGQKQFGCAPLTFLFRRLLKILLELFFTLSDSRVESQLIFYFSKKLWFPCMSCQFPFLVLF